MEPYIRRIDGSRTLQLSYGLPHRVHTAEVYPIAAPNGSTIIVYGHAHGLRILWKGGRPLKKPSKKKAENIKTNGINNDAIMVIDSDDEEPPAKPAQPYKDEAEFEDEEVEYDPTAPFETLIQTLDLPLGTDVLHISFPQLPPDTDLTTGSVPKILSQKLVIAMACSDCSIRLITLPLCPPSPASKARPELRSNVSLGSTGNGMWGEQMIVIPSNIGHQSIPRSVSITFSAQGTDDTVMDEDEEEGEPEPRSRSALRASSGGRSRSREPGNGEWDFIVASHSDALSGVLLLFRIPIVVNGRGDSTLTAEHIILWRTKYLPSPAVSVSFSSSLYPAKWHTRVLVAEAKGAVRIYDPFATPSASDGEWLISLYPGFESSPLGIPERKNILASRWVLGGKALLVLLTDGEWGIWDIQNAGPKPKDQIGLPHGSSKVCLASFALSGWVGNQATTTSSTKSSSGKSDSKSKLAPMTPHMRKVRQEALFSGPARPNSSHPARGGITVIPIGAHSSNRRADDETVLLWYGNNIITIPSLLTHWRNKVTGSGNLFGTGARGQIREIHPVDLGGELRNGVTIIRKHSNSKEAATPATELRQDILVTGEKSLVIVAAPIPEPKEPSTFTQPAPAATLDQRLLAREELDVNGIERILASMANGAGNAVGSQRSKQGTKGAMPKRKVGFSTSR